MKEKILKTYYTLTPVMWLLDIFTGLDIRVAALDGFPVAKAFYYLFCIGCAWILWKGFSWGTLVALGESSISIVMLVVGYLMPLMQFTDIDLVQSGQLYAPPDPIMRGINFLLVGTAANFSFQHALKSLNPRPL